MKWYEAVNGLRLMWALVLISVIGSASFADETTAKRLAATKLIKTPFIQETLDERFSRKEIIENSKIPPNVTEAHVAAVWEITEAALGKVRPKIENAMIESASQTFSIEELDVLAAFYSVSRLIANLEFTPVLRTSC